MKRSHRGRLREKERIATIVKTVTGRLPPIDLDDCTFEDDGDDDKVWSEPVGWSYPQGCSWNPPIPTRRPS